MNIVITGANRGLGLGFTRHYLAQGHYVWACFRQDPGELAKLKSGHLHLVRMDVGHEIPGSTLDELPAQVDLLINNAGIYGPSKDGQDLAHITSAAMLDVFNIDCVGPLRVVQALQNRLGQGCVIANISSKMGSSTDNSSGGTYAYRAAKAALIIVSRSMGIDLAAQGVRVLCLHPGWVQTDMTRHTGLIDVDTSVAGMCSVIARADIYETGAFVAFDGSLIPY